ncbi:DUF6192 family protein [Streptomyces sp. NPDC003006]
MFAEDIGLAHSTVRDYRWVASRWPKQHRRSDVSHTIHTILASIPDEAERFEAVNNPCPSRAAGRRGGRTTVRNEWAGRSTPFLGLHRHRAPAADRGCPRSAAGDPGQDLGYRMLEDGTHRRCGSATSGRSSRSWATA